MKPQVNLTPLEKMMNMFTNIRSFHMRHRIAAAAVAAILMAGCASTPPPTAQMAVSHAAISNASSAGANEFAPLQLKSAMEKMDGAEHAMAKENYALAKQLAEQAQVEAELAAATARSDKAQKAADAVQEDNSVLRQEIDRNNSNLK